MSDQLVWTFDTVPFYPLDSSRLKPEPKREGRVEVVNLLGTGYAEFNTFGFTEYSLDLQVLVRSDADAAALKAKHLTMKTLMYGPTTIATAMLVDVDLKQRGPDYHEGSLRFKWSGA